MIVVRTLVLGLLALAGCVTSEATRCEDGSVCPAGTACALVTIDAMPTRFCVDKTQLTDCAGRADGEPCLVRGEPSTCHDQVCLPDRCGNFLVDHFESCDDGDVEPGDGCSSDCRSDETCGNTILDAVRGEQCDLGDALAHDGCTSTCQLEEPDWEALVDVLPRKWTAVAYDARRHRVIMFAGAPNLAFVHGDTQEWDGRQWTRPATPTAPSPRHQHAMACDAARGQIVMFGGDQVRDTWTYDVRGWTLQTPVHVPPARSFASMVYDAAHQRVVMFGGYDDERRVTAQTWIWDGADWQELPATTPAPAARAVHAMAYDPVRGVVVVFGGLDDAYLPIPDGVWELDGSQWTQRLPSGSAPTPRAYAPMTFDPTLQKVLLVGGTDTSGSRSDAWTWDGTQWAQVADVPIAGGVLEHALASDADRGRSVLIGTNGDVREFDGSQWTLATQTTADTPSARYYAAAATDPLRRQLVLFGGRVFASPSHVNDTWYWQGSWFQATTPTALAARGRTSLVYDRIRDELVMFGGCTDGANFADTWVWRHADASDPGHWEQRMPATSPAARCNHVIGWDDVRGRVILLGGTGNAPPDEQWSWDGVDWQLDPVSAPGDRVGASFGYDPIRRELVVFGGLSITLNRFLDDTWVWNGQAWTERTPTVRPSRRWYAPLAWDAARGRLVLFGGEGIGTTKTQDVWEWDGTTWSLVPTKDPPSPRFGHATAAAIEGAGVVLLGGFAGNQASSAPIADVIRLRWDGARTDEACTTADTDGDGLAACSDPDCWRVCSPLCAPGVTSCPSGPRCGDLTCDLVEAHDSCPSDCP